MPFAKYKGFTDCVTKSGKKPTVYDPKGYCAAIERKVSKHKGRKNPPSHPDELGLAQKVAKGFHGKLEGSITNVLEQEKYASNLAELGIMEDMELESGLIVVFPEFPLSRRPRLCSSSDGDQLYIVGGRQELTGKDMEALGVEFPDRDYIVIGPIAAISYITAKYHLSKKDRKPGTYRHEFGEEGGELPILVYDNINRRQGIYGGSYTIEDEGIRN